MYWHFGQLNTDEGQTIRLAFFIMIENIVSK
jgi:hypothetical protein